MKTLALALLLLAGAPLEAAVAGSVADDLKGDWETAFLNDPSGFVQVRYKLSFDGQGHCKESADAVINHPLGHGGLRLEMDCTYSLGAASAGVPGAYDVDYVYLRQRITLLSQSMVDDDNKSAYCGYSDWQLGVPKDTTDRLCEEDTFHANTPSYDLVGLGTKGELLRGKIPNTDSTPLPTAADRPTALDAKKPYYRPGQVPPGGGDNGGGDGPDLLPGLYQVTSRTENPDGCDGPGSPVAGPLGYLDLYANTTVVTGMPGWSDLACPSPAACAAAPKRILLMTPWPLSETDGDAAWKGHATSNSWLGQCRVEATFARATRSADGRLSLSHQSYAGVLAGATSGDDCSRRAHKLDPVKDGLRCTSAGTLEAQLVQP